MECHKFFFLAHLERKTCPALMSDGQFGQFHTGEKIYGSASVKITNWSRFVPVFDEDETCVMHVYIYIYIYIYIQYVCRYYIPTVCRGGEKTSPVRWFFYTGVVHGFHELRIPKPLRILPTRTSWNLTRFCFTAYGVFVLQ